MLGLEYRLAPMSPFVGVKLIDERSLRCEYEDGIAPYLLHHTLAKPWLETTFQGIYSHLLRRALIGDDIAISLPRRMLPLRMRGGPVPAYAERQRINAGHRLRWRVGKRWRRTQTRRS